MTQPLCAIIIPHFNDVERLLRCLSALLPQVTPEVEVVVVDNGSTQPLDPVRAAWPDLRIVTEPIKGAAAARNRGVAETKAQALLFLDCDCVPAENWLARARGVIGQADIIGGAIDVFDETPPPRSGAEAFETIFAFDNRAYIETKGFSVTANLVTTRTTFERTGPFRPGLSEDLDWCHRATAAGAGLAYDENLRVAHPTRPDWPTLRHKWRRLTDEAWGLRQATLPARTGWVLRALAMPVSVAAHAPRIFFSPRLDGPGERFAAFATLLRLRLLRCVWMLRQALGPGHGDRPVGAQSR
jgi:glycosyltransferase involved in cell wall biosynthesis